MTKSPANEWEKQFEMVKLTMCDSQDYLEGHNRGLDKGKTITKWALNKQLDELEEKVKEKMPSDLTLDHGEQLDAGYAHAVADITKIIQEMLHENNR